MKMMSAPDIVLMQPAGVIVSSDWLLLQSDAGCEAFIFVNRALTSMKILHAEYGGLVIYNLKLEKGCISLPDMQLDDDDSPPHRLTQWQELVLMTQGINPLEVKRSPRWLPQKSRKEKIG